MWMDVGSEKNGAWRRGLESGRYNNENFILRLNYIGPMNKNNEGWSLGIEEVNRIKAGVLKYIEQNHNQKSKDRSSHSPSTPTSTFQNRTNQTPKTKPKQSQSPLQSKSSVNRVKPRQIPQNLGTMPRGYQQDRNGKIIRTGQVVNQQPSTFVKQKIDNKSGKFGIIEKYDVVAQNCYFVEGQGEKRMQVKVIAQEKIGRKSIKQEVIQPVKQKPPVEQIKLISNEPPAQATKTPSVFELARLFGGFSSKKQTAPKPQQKKVPNIKTTLVEQSIAQKQGTIQSLERVSGQEIKSLASFGRSEKSKGMRISEFLDMRVAQNKKRQTQKLRKRSYTFQQNISPLQSQQVPRQPNNRSPNIPQQWASTNKHNTSIVSKNDKISQLKVNQFKTISFDEKQQQELREKYSVLSKKLDQLKFKVLEECGEKERRKAERNRPIDHQIQTLRIYNKYSPLKNLQRIRNKKMRESQIEQIERERSRSIKFENYLRSG